MGQITDFLNEKKVELQKQNVALAEDIAAMDADITRIQQIINKNTVLMTKMQNAINGLGGQ